MKSDELKDNFIKYFGEEKWNQEEALATLYKEEFKLCNYLGIDPIPVITDTIEEDSRYYIEENYIVISDKLSFGTNCDWYIFIGKGRMT